MSITHSTRLFRSGAASTLYLTVPAALVADSQFPFGVDDSLTVTIDGDQLIVTVTGDGDEA